MGPPPARHPWLGAELPRVPSLSDHVRVWTFLAAHTARGDCAAVARDWEYLPEPARAGGLEIILQTHLFAGYPRTINALAAVGGAGELGIAEPEAGTPESWRAQGEAACGRIYGAAYDRLRGRIAGLHPALDRWMVEIGYGRVLSRPGPTLRERELCVLAVLAGQNVPAQLASHLRGARNAGATTEECRAVLSQTRLTWGSAAQAEVDHFLEELP
jgi:4-carboxymuconolactone decarboxylase